MTALCTPSRTALLTYSESALELTVETDDTDLIGWITQRCDKVSMVGTDTYKFSIAPMVSVQNIISFIAHHTEPGDCRPDGIRLTRPLVRTDQAGL